MREFPRNPTATLAAALLIACGEDGGGSDMGQLGGTKDSGPDGAGASVPEASTGSNDGSADATTYPIDPNGPPPDCILPCVWEVMKRCPGPQPGQSCVSDTISRPSEVLCCAMDPPVPEEPVTCSDESWVGLDVNRGAFANGEWCWWRSGESSAAAPGPPPRPADWTSTWYARDETTGEDVRIATLAHADPSFPNALVGQGTCLSGEDPVFTTDMDFRAEHCQQWYPSCDVAGTCPLPPDWIHENDAGPADAATDATGAAPVDAASTLDATRDAPQGG